MALGSRCYYFRGKGAGEVAAEAEAMARDVIDRVLMGGIDGDNIVEDLVDPDGGLAWDMTFRPRRLYSPILRRKKPGTIQRKGSSETNAAGIEVHVDASDAIYGRFCVVDSGTPETQRISLVPEPPATVADPGGTIATPTGTMILEGKAGDEIVVNESGADVDFRVESDGNANALVVDAGANRVGVLRTPGVPLDVAGKIRSDDQIESTIAIGTAPLVVASTTAVTNLNADMVDGSHASAFETAAAVATHEAAANPHPQYQGGVTDHGMLAGLGDDDHTQYQTRGEKGLANGYASLDAGGVVVQNPATASAIPAASKIPIADGAGKLDAGWIPASVATDAEVETAINAHATAADPHAGYQKESEKGQNNGYASLGALGTVLQLPSMAFYNPTDTGQIPLSTTGAVLSDNWLSANVPRLNGENTWTGANGLGGGSLFDFGGGVAQIRRGTSAVGSLASGEYYLRTSTSMLYVGV